MMNAHALGLYYQAQRYAVGSESAEDAAARWAEHLEARGQADDARQLREVRPMYSIARRHTGPHRWAVTRNGEPLALVRNRATAVRDAENLAKYLELMGEESHMLEHYARYPVPPEEVN